MTTPEVPLRAFVFDAFGTLFDVLAVGSQLETIAPGKGEALGTLWRGKQLEYLWLSALMRRYQDFETLTRRALEHVCAGLEVDLARAQADVLMQAYGELPTYAEVPSALRKLNERGIPCLILSNGTKALLERLVAHHGLEDAFSALLSVEPLATYKPHPAVYGLALDRLGMAPGEIGFVSSNAWDAIGGGAVGLHAIWINRFGRAAETLAPVPRRVVGSLMDLLPLVGG